MSVDRFRYALAHEYRYVLLSDWLLPNRWYHVALTFDGIKSVFYLQGVPVDTYSINSKVRPRATKIAIGDVLPDIYKFITFVGNITQLNIWQKILSQQELLKISTCTNNAEGDVVSWSDQWKMINIKTYTVALESLCENTPSKSVELLDIMRFDEAAFLCEGFGGELVVPKDYDHAADLVTKALQEHPECKLYWGGLWDEKSEGQWVKHIDGQPLDNVPWVPGEPDGIHFENCGGIDYEGFIDDDCDAQRYVIPNLYLLT